jgi:hypothetical protein
MSRAADTRRRLASTTASRATGGRWIAVRLVPLTILATLVVMLATSCGGGGY